MRKSPLALALAALFTLATVTSCSSLTPGPAPTPAHTFAAIIFSGSVSGEKDIRPPAGAHSASVTVICGGQSYFTLSGALNPDVDGLNGSCGGGSHRYEMAVGALRTLHLQIELSKGGGFVVETQFSRDPLVVNDELTAQCSAMVTVGSDVFNAEEGYTRGALSLAEWRQKISDAAGALQSLDPEKANVLSAPLQTIRGMVTREGLAPGAFHGDAAADYIGAVNIVGQVCAENGTATYVNADYGG